jgi:hypothetical protein
METRDYIEFREVDNPQELDTDIQVFFLGVHVHTIKNVDIRPGGHVYVEKEQCVRRAQQAVQHLWDLTEGPSGSGG